MKRKVYVASSWRNEAQEILVKELRLMGYDVYDFKHPDGGEPGFQWSKLDENWQGWSMEQYRKALKDDYARFGFNRDFDAMKEADVCVLCLPCGRSAHLEAGWMKGVGKRVIAFIPPESTIEPELMYGLLDGIALSFQDVERLLKVQIYEYGAISLRYSIEADNKLTAYAGMVAHFGSNNHLVALYEPKEIVKNDSWFNPFGYVSKRLDEIFGGEGSFDKYVDEHLDEIREAMKTIKVLS